MMQIAKTQIVYWFFMALLLLTLTISALGFVLTTHTAQTSGFHSEPTAVLACQGPGGGSNGSSGYC